jgi:hypothetical protein
MFSARRLNGSPSRLKTSVCATGAGSKDENIICTSVPVFGVFGLPFPLFLVCLCNGADGADADATGDGDDDDEDDDDTYEEEGGRSVAIVSVCARA